MSNLEKVKEAFDSLIEISINKELNVKLRGQIIKDAKESLPLLDEAIAERDRLRVALTHCDKVFRSLADRGFYPEEFYWDSKHFMGIEGIGFINKALEGK